MTSEPEGILDGNIPQDGSIDEQVRSLE